MELPLEIFTLLKNQYNYEIYSGLLYKKLSDRSEYLGYEGLSLYLYNGYKEELEHSDLFRKLIIDLNYEPIVEFKNYEDINIKELDYIGILEFILDHEQIVSEKIHTILEECRRLKFYYIEKFLIDFLNEQIEEEAKIIKIIDKFQAFQGKNILFRIDKELFEKE
jgi:ferritin